MISSETILYRSIASVFWEFFSFLLFDLEVDLSSSEDSIINTSSLFEENYNLLLFG